MDETTNPMMNSWLNASTQMWKNWFELITPGNGNSTSGIPPQFAAFAPPFAGNQTGFNPWLYSFNAWKDILGQFQSGLDWQKPFQNYTEDFRKQLDAFSGKPFQSGQDIADISQLWTQQLMKFNEILTAYWGAAVPALSQTASGKSQPWIELNHLYWNMLYDPLVGDKISSPTTGPTREYNAKLQKVIEAGTKFSEASIDYQLVLSEIMVRSFQGLMQKLVALAQKGEKVEDLRKFQQLYSQVTDGIFEETFLAEENLKIRGNFLNSLNYYRLQQQELMEYWMVSLNLPVRSEVDEIHRHVYELNKEVKALKKRLAKYEAMNVDS